MHYVAAMPFTCVRSLARQLALSKSSSILSSSPVCFHIHEHHLLVSQLPLLVPASLTGVDQTRQD